jgi:hypothetical protein
MVRTVVTFCNTSLPVAMMRQKDHAKLAKPATEGIQYDCSAAIMTNQRESALNSFFAGLASLA